MNLQAHAGIDFQHLFLQFIQTGGCQPLQLTQQVQCNGLFGPSGTVFDLDRHPEALACATEALNTLGAPLDNTWP